MSKKQTSKPLVDEDERFGDKDDTKNNNVKNIIVQENYSAVDRLGVISDDSTLDEESGISSENLSQKTNNR